MAGESQNYFLKESDNVLPDYRINNIIVEEKSIRLFCSLDRDDDINYDSWFGSSEFLKYVNFYFILTGKLTPTSLAKIYYPKTRVQSLSGGQRATGESMLEWESVFKLKETQPGSNVRTRQNGVINPIFGYIKVNLDEVSRGENYKSNSSSGFSAIGVDSVINGTAFTNTDPGDDTFFEVVLDCDDGWLQIDQTSQSEQHRNIVSFCQLDVKALSEEYGLQNFIGTLKEYGGPMHYEKLLELSPFVGESGRSSVERLWSVPETVDYFEDQQGNPHDGIAHYHSDEEGKRGPNGYVGWMSGPPGTDMQGRKLLSRRQIPNTKIVSKIHVGRQLGFDGNPISDANRFSGYPDALSTQGSDVPSPYGDLSFGDNIMSVLKSEVGMGMLEIQASGENLNPLNTIAGAKMKKLVLKKESGSRSNFIDAASCWISTTLAKHATLFSINKEHILKSNSQYGYLLDYHREKLDPDAATERRMLENSTLSQRMSYSILKGCIKETKVYTMKVYRRRLTNLPLSNNELGTPDYVAYNEERSPEILINFSDSNDFPAGNPDSLEKAELVEVFSDFYSTRGISCLYRLDDFDLYQNATQGRYKYTIELTLVDGVKKYLKDSYNRYFQAMKRFESFVKEAEKPYITYPATDSTTPSDNGGSYDYKREQFSQTFLDIRAEDFDTTITDAVHHVTSIYYLLNKKDHVAEVKFYQDLVRQLQPANADIGNIKMFLDFMQKLGNSLKQKIFKNGTDIEGTMNLGTHKRRVGQGSGYGYPNDLIKLKSDIRKSIKVASKNSVFFDVGDDDSDPQLSEEVNNFFTLQSEVLTNTRAEQQTRNPEIDNAIAFNSNGDTFNRRTNYLRRSIGDYATNYSEIISATEYSPYGESYSSQASTQHTDPLNDHNLSVMNFGGATFSSLLSNTLSLSEVSTNECGEQVTSLSTAVEQSIFDSIVALDNKDDFLRQVDEQYKGYYFTKEALGNLYTFIKHTMSNRNALSNMNVDRTESRLSRYRRRVLNGTQAATEASQRSRLRRDQIGPTTSPLTDLYVYTATRGFVLASEDPEDSLGVFERRVRSNITAKNGATAVLVNNVYVVENSQNSAGSMTPLRMTSTTRTTGISRTGNTPRTPTITTGGGTSGGY